MLSLSLSLLLAAITNAVLAALLWAQHKNIKKSMENTAEAQAWAMSEMEKSAELQRIVETQRRTLTALEAFQ